MQIQCRPRTSGVLDDRPCDRDEHQRDERCVEGETGPPAAVDPRRRVVVVIGAAEQERVGHQDHRAEHCRRHRQVRGARDVQRNGGRTHGSAENGPRRPHRVERVDDRAPIVSLHAQRVCVLPDIGERIDAPATNKVEARRTADGASAARNTNTAIPMLPTTATRADRKRRISAPAARPTTSAPAENAAIATP